MSVKRKKTEEGGAEDVAQAIKTLQSLKSSLKTCLFGLFVPLNDITRGKHFRHPFPTGGFVHKIDLLITTDLFHWRITCSADATGITNVEPIEPNFMWIVRITIFTMKDKEQKVLYNTRQGVTLFPVKRSDVTYFASKQQSARLNTMESNEFHVSVCLSVMPDEEIYEAFQSREEPLLTPHPSTPTIPTINERLWESRKNADLVVVPSGNIEIKVHRCFLMESSEVFNAMFTHDTKEKSSGRLVLDDLPYDAVDQMLQFIYLEKITSDDVQVLTQLLQVANRYDLQLLSSAAQNILIKLFYSRPFAAIDVLPTAHALNLCTLKSVAEEAAMWSMKENFISCFMLATFCGAKRLQRLAAACLLTDRHPPVLDEEWGTLQSTYPELAQALLDAYVECSILTCPADILPGS